MREVKRFSTPQRYTARFAISDFEFDRPGSTFDPVENAMKRAEGHFYQRAQADGVTLVSAKDWRYRVETSESLHARVLVIEAVGFLTDQENGESDTPGLERPTPPENGLVFGASAEVVE